MKEVSKITHDFQVSAISQFLPKRSNPDIPLFFFTYRISITNNSDKQAQLINRHWKITDAIGRIHKVNGEGVIGEQPSFLPGQNFQYNSGCPLTTEFGFMTGYYDMIREDDVQFKIVIPEFCLSSPNSAN